MMQANYYCFSVRWIFMALLKSVTHLDKLTELCYNANHCEYRASPSQRVVGAGGAGEVQGEHEQLGFGRLLIPPAKK
jgi:hypothetical protein